MIQEFVDSFFYAGYSAGMIGLILLFRSLTNFSRTGPEIRAEIQTKFFYYSIYALARLVAWSVLIAYCLILPGTILGSLSARFVNNEHGFIFPAFCGLLGFALIFTRFFLHYLLYNPGIIVTSASFDTSRLFSVWQRLNPDQLKILDTVVVFTFIGPDCFFLAKFILFAEWGNFSSLFLISSAYYLAHIWLHLSKEPDPIKTADKSKYPNVLMIGSDTLRADHLGCYGHSRPTSPFIDSLVQRSSLFKSCYVPLARTAPSLVSLFTGCWPDTHGIKENFISDVQAKNMDLPSLADCLKKSGYNTSTISDWSGSDLGKFELGFQNKKLPEDQWNIKYLIRQGPKDIRLFLSLFVHNPFGKFFLPELYYLAGIPLTQQLGLEARRELTKLAQERQPFFLNLFLGTTHPPFSSNYPYYQLFSDPDYQGRSKFCMSRLTTPEEIIESQQEPREAFDLDQIIALYDGSIRQFDDEVKKIVNYIDRCGLSDNTIIVIYSDHGMDLFEHDTWGQGNSITGDFSARIPLIIHDPRTKSHRIHHEKVRSIDVMPTLLELCGIEIPDTVDGVSLKPLMEGNTLDQELTVFYETGIWLSIPPRQKLNHISYPDIFNLLEIKDTQTGTLSLKLEYIETIESARDRFIWQEPWKLKSYALMNGPYYELFNTSYDPDCNFDLAKNKPEIVARLIENAIFRNKVQPSRKVRTELIKNS